MGHDVMNRPKDSLIFDGECPLCVRQVRLLRRLDWWDGIRPRAITSLTATEKERLPAEEILLTAIHCLTPTGAVLAGAACLRHIGLRVPLLTPLALLLYLPGMLFIAQKAYEWISRHRHALSRRAGLTGTCASPAGCGAPAADLHRSDAKNEDS